METELRSSKTKVMIKMAIMIALIYLATFFIKIPSINGYTHLGDCMIFLSVLILGTKRGALAGGIGAALADYLGGYIIWVIPTFFIKILYVRTSSALSFPIILLLCIIAPPLSSILFSISLFFNSITLIRLFLEPVKVYK